MPPSYQLPAITNTTMQPARPLIDAINARNRNRKATDAIYITASLLGLAVLYILAWILSGQDATVIFTL